MVTIPNTLEGQIVHLFNRIGELERRARNRKRTGTIEEGPDDQGRYRVKLTEGDGSTPFLTGWIKPKTVSAGGTKIDVVYTAGEQVDVTSESGDLTDAVIDFSTYSDSNARANSANAAVHLTNGGTTVEIANGTVTITTPNVKITANVEITGDVKITGPVDITGDVNLTGDYVSTGTMTNNGKDVGSTHTNMGLPVD